MEHEEIRAAVLEVKASLTADDYKVIRRAIEQLDKKTRRFAEIMMDSAVSGALQGKTMNSAGESMGEGPSAPHPFAKAEIEESEPKNLIERCRGGSGDAGRVRRGLSYCSARERMPLAASSFARAAAASR